MPLPLIARDLYRLYREVDRLEKMLADAPNDRLADLKRKLARVKTERDEMKRMLEGHLDR